jgi:hypothetical protein
MKKLKGKFYQTFDETRLFDSNELVISSELYPKEEAITKFYNDLCGEKDNAQLHELICSNIKDGFVKYGIKTTIDGITSAWWISDKVKGAMPVYIVDEKICRL